MEAEIEKRLDLAKTLAGEAGSKALAYFTAIGDLVIEQKGSQDLVSNADREVETFIRERLQQEFPDDGIVGEEHDDKPSRSGYIWVIDPIDGTANFVRGIPAWTVVLGCIHDDRTKIGVIHEPCNGEMFWGSLGHGACLNGKPIKVAHTRGLDDGSLGVGMNGRTPAKHAVDMIDRLVNQGGVFYRNASGALMLAYVAAGRLIGYVESHMNAWDCLAGQLLIAEAGGLIEKQSANAMLESGGRVIASTPVIFDQLVEMAERAYRA